MKKIWLSGLLVTLVFSALSFAQVLTSENPFPESATQAQSIVFDTSKPLTFRGTISQEISRPTSNMSYLFFRMVVNGKTWTIKIHDQQLQNFVRSCVDCLVDDYTPEMSRLKNGMTVVVSGYETKQRDNRLLLLPVRSQKNVAGIVITGGTN